MSHYTFCSTKKNKQRLQGDQKPNLEIYGFIKGRGVRSNFYGHFNPVRIYRC